MIDARVVGLLLDDPTATVAADVAVACPAAAVAVGFEVDEDVQPATAKADNTIITARIAVYAYFIISIILYALINRLSTQHTVTYVWSVEYTHGKTNKP
jgi:hypothetical protein